jgi:hypothetical protein
VIAQVTEEAFWFWYEQGFDLLDYDTSKETIQEYCANGYYLDRKLHLMWKHQTLKPGKIYEYLEERVSELIPAGQNRLPLNKKELKELKPVLKASVRTNPNFIDRMAELLANGLPKCMS